MLLSFLMFHGSCVAIMKSCRLLTNLCTFVCATIVRAPGLLELVLRVERVPLGIAIACIDAVQLRVPGLLALVPARVARVLLDACPMFADSVLPQVAGLLALVLANVASVPLDINVVRIGTVPLQIACTLALVFALVA